MRLQAGQRKTENIQRFSAMFFSQKGLFTLAAFLLSLSFGIAFYVHFRTYHAALDKLDKLTTLFHNPNARVASGEQGKRILKKLGVGTKKEKKEAKQNHLDDTLQKVAELLQKSKEPQVEAAVNYKPPEIVEEANTISSYKLPDMPTMTQPLLGAAHQQPAPQPYFHPGQFQISPPVLPMPQVVSAPAYYPTIQAPSPVLPKPQEIKVAISKPEPIAEPAPTPKVAPKPAGIESLTKADLLKLLVAQLAKENDIEKQA